VRHMSSAPIAPVPEAAQPPEPNFWIATPAPLSTDVGLNRASWDLRYDAPPAFTHSFEINANPGLTPASPEGPLALPGVYTLRLTVDGKSSTQKVTVKADPRSPASAADLVAQHALLMKVYGSVKAAWDDYHRAVALRDAITKVATPNAPSDVNLAAPAIEAKLESLAGSPRRGFGGGGGFGGRSEAPPTFMSVSSDLVNQLNALDNGDMAPTAAMRAAADSAAAHLKTNEARLGEIVEKDLPAFNTLLERHQLTKISTAAMDAAPSRLPRQPAAVRRQQAAGSPGRRGG